MGDGDVRLRDVDAADGRAVGLDDDWATSRGAAQVEAGERRPGPGEQDADVVAVARRIGGAARDPRRRRRDAAVGLVADHGVALADHQREDLAVGRVVGPRAHHDRLARRGGGERVGDRREGMTTVAGGAVAAGGVVDAQTGGQSIGHPAGLRADQPLPPGPSWQTVAGSVLMLYARRLSMAAFMPPPIVAVLPRASKLGLNCLTSVPSTKILDVPPAGASKV
jgi:hypothetical protein